MNFGDSFIGQSVYHVLNPNTLGYIKSIGDISDIDRITVLIDVGDGIEYEKYELDLLEPCKGIF